MRPWTASVDSAEAVWSEPTAHALPDGSHVRLVMANDPDGTAIECIEGAATRVSFVAVCCSDLEQSLAFYRALGFEERARSRPTPTDAAHLHLPGPMGMDEIMLSAPGGGEVRLVLVGFRVPAARCRVPARPANALGMWRTALLVGDLDAACARARGVAASRRSPPIVEMQMGPGLPALRFVCFRGPDHEVIELIEQPQ